MLWVNKLNRDRSQTFISRRYNQRPERRGRGNQFVHRRSSVNVEEKRVERSSLIGNSWYGGGWRFFKKGFRFLGFLIFLGFNVPTVALGTLETEIRPRRRPINED